MRSLKSTPGLNWFVLLFTVFSLQGFSQINSPYSRYGLGDLYNSRNVASKGMGNLATPYIDYQSVNFINPAAYSRLQAVTFDLGIEFESRAIYNPDRSENFRSNNLSFNYLALGLPLLKNKQGATTWGFAFGLRPVTRMNYSIAVEEFLPSINDSVQTLYEGSGGASKAFLGTGFRVKGFSLGANVGFLFGQQNVTTQRRFIYDTLQHFAAHYESNVSYTKVYADVGAQYDIKLGKNSNLRLGFTGYFGEKLNASSDLLRETIFYNAIGGFDSIDVAYRERNVKGTINMPSGYSVGLMFDKTGSWMLGAEFERTNWSNYSFYGSPDLVGNTAMFRMGGQWIPDANTQKYLNRVTYRAGFYSGTDYITVNGNQLPLWAITLGFGFPVRRWNNYSNQFTSVNTSFEFGKRGNSNHPLSENFFRLNVGLSLSDIWFIKRKFD